MNTKPNCNGYWWLLTADNVWEPVEIVYTSGRRMMYRLGRAALEEIPTEDVEWVRMLTPDKAAQVPR